ncbi:hypothetical protein J7X25_004549 [Vibrio parahaemolyticus]|nr:hypothetical protein [Vibrio parahaemolyticus]EKA7380090.1 hypothetical protein [Vibrio parahaemolyticus]
MESVLIEIDDMVSELRELVDGLTIYIEDKPVSKQVRDGVSSFLQHLTEYSKVSQEDDIDKLTSSAKAVAIYGLSIGQGIAKLKDVDSQMASIGDELVSKSTKFKNLIENSPLEYQSLKLDNSLKNDAEVTSFKSVKTNLKKLSDSHLQHDQRIKKLLSENDLRITELNDRVSKIDDTANAEIANVTELYKQALEDVESKNKQIDDILGHVSGRAISGDYEESAAEEKKMANWLRYASLACMLTIVVVVGYSFLETTSADFQWQKSLFRIVLAMLLSVPAAYLARESAKHREQQYRHLQTSLDLKTISPYIASLPDEEQHKIKSEVASRLFAARDFSKVSSDPYPINMHEIIMELLKKVDVGKSTNSK